MKSESKVKMGGIFTIVCRDKNGKIKWQDKAKNLVTNQGLQYLLDAGLLDGTQITTWYLGLTDDSPTPAAGDTLASHGGWTEFTEYDEAARQSWGAARSGQTVSNGTAVGFSINAAGGGVGGAFVASAASGTAGTLLCAAALSGGNRAVADGDTVSLTYSFTAADDGA